MADHTGKPNSGRVPQDRAAREALCDLAAACAREEMLVAPLSLDELRDHARRLIDEGRLDAAWHDLFLVELHNAVWESAVASIPFDRRLLLLPRCLRNVEHCEGEPDDVGLLCAECGRCSLSSMQQRAEELGYVVLIAEGTSVVTKLLNGGKVDAVIGVSCMEALEKSFPYLAAEAVPGLAVALWRDGCTDTAIDDDRVMRYIETLTDSGASRPLDMIAIRDEVRSWFAPRPLIATYGGDDSETERIACEWLVRGGKRWRPFLCVCVHRALSEETSHSESIACLALAIECFHKASLAHDDIEDDDDTRYNAPTLHCQHDVAVALNIGDTLTGRGYGLIAEAGLPAHVTADLLAVAAEGHRQLCLGQGEELLSRRRAVPPSSQEMIRIFQWKTAPAFDVALQFGAAVAGAPPVLRKVLTQYSVALGIGYQLQDDLHEWQASRHSGEPAPMDGSILASVANELGTPDIRKRIVALRQSHDAAPEDWRKVIESTGADAKVEQMLKYYRGRANGAVNGLTNSRLKSVLRRVAGQLLAASEPVASESLTVPRR